MQILAVRRNLDKTNVLFDCVRRRVIHLITAHLGRIMTALQRGLELRAATH